MAVPPLEANNAAIQQLLWALGITTAIIFSLIGVIYHAHTKRQDDQQTQLDDGQDEFTKGKVEFARLKKDVESLRVWLESLEKKLEQAEQEQKKQHDTLIKIKVMHKGQHDEEIE